MWESDVLTVYGNGELGLTKTKYMINPSYEFPYARSIMNDFVTLLRNEGNDPSNKNGINNRGIDTTIISNCKKNFEKKSNNICFCCGEPILFY